MDSHVWQAILLGVIQGLTEFLPISSSGHLAIAQELLPGFRQPGILLDVLLHFGTLIAVMAYFRSDLVALVRSVVGARLIAPLQKDNADPPAPGWRLLMALIVASIPTGLIGFLLKDRVEEAFGSLRAVGAALLGTAFLLVLGDIAARRRERRVGAVREPPLQQDPGNRTVGAKLVFAPGVQGRSQGSPLPQDPGIWQSLVIGFMQGLAVMPGLSRSGSTISAGLIVGLEGVVAARFSFLLSIPAVAGATAITLLKHLDEIQAAAAGEIAGYLLGPLAAAAVGYAGIGLMMRVMKKARLGYFAIYCALLGIAIMLVEYR